MNDLFSDGKTKFVSEDFSEITRVPDSLDGMRFTDCRFNSLDFLETTLNRTVFERCSFDFTRIGVKMTRCAFLNCSFRYANLLGAMFDECKMTGSYLSEASNSGYDIKGGDWSYTEISKLRLKKSDLSGANFTCANLFDCRFEKCDLSGAKFDNAVINSLSLKDSKLYGASFAFVNFGQINFKNCEADIDFAVTFTRAHGIKI